MRKLAFCCIFLLAGYTGICQDFSNKGKDFWVGYGYHQVMNAGNGQNMVLYFVTDGLPGQLTNVTVTIPGVGYSQSYSNLAPNTVTTSLPIPKAGVQDARLMTETSTPHNKGIHIVADRPIVAYAHIYNQSVSGATILFPTNTLGKEYYSINYTNLSNTNNANSWFYVVACDTGTTTVEIIPSANTLTHPAGVPFTVSLTQGEIYNFMGALTGGGGGSFTGVDLTGSKIRSIATASGACKRIGVFSGSGRISIHCNGAGGSSDNYMVQSFPKSAWGRKFLTAPTGGLPRNIFRVCVSDPATVVTLNGGPMPYVLQGNFYYEIPATASPMRIEADQPITVAQYITSYGGCGNPTNGNNGDPEVIYLSPVEQNISKVIWNATPNFAIQQHYYTVVIPNTGTALSSFRLNGNPVGAGAFINHPQQPGYSYLTQSVVAGQNTIESDSGFNAIAYGMGNAESYGYNAGTNVRDLLQQVGVTSQYGIEQIPSVCIGSPFKFRISLPYMVDSMRWNLSALPGSPPNQLVTYSNPPVPTDADSVRIINGKTVYWYSLPNYYTFNTVGTYPVVVTAYASNAEGCGNEQEINFELEINNPPVADFAWVHNGCVDQPVQFNDQTTSIKPTYRWWWDFGDPASGANNTANIANPVHQFSAPGTYTVRYSNITTPGCLSDTIQKTIVIHPLPVGNVSGDINVCLNGPSPNVIFTGTVGTAPFTFTYNINNGAPQTATTTTGNSISVPVPTSAVGTFNYYLVSIKDNAGTAGCVRANPDTVSVVVSPLPTASISGTVSVCQNAPSPTITFNASGGAAAPYTFSYNINGGATQTVSTTTNTATVSVPTNTAGTFVYNLLSVSDGSAAVCSQLQNGSATITVNGLPTASISGSAEACVGTTSPTVTFTGANGAAPYTFTYSLNGGPDQVIVSTGNTATITVPTTTAGSFTYVLKSVRESSSTNCSQLQSGTATVVIHPLPTAGFTVSTPTCVTRTITFTDNSAPNVGTITNWNWNFGDPASGASNTSTLQNPTHVFGTAGTYNVTLTVTNSEGCISTVSTQQVNINTLPTSNFSLPEVCLLDPFAQFSDLSTAISPATVSAWSWNFGDPGSGTNNTSTVQNAQHTYSAVGNYNVSLVAITNNGCTDTLTQVLTVNGGNPQANFIQLNTATACSSDSISIQNKSTIASGNITKVEIHWDNTNQPTVFELDDVPVFDKIYKHKYPTSTNTLTYNVRFRAYSGGVCVHDRILPVTVLATPSVQLADFPDQCLIVATPTVLNQGTESGGVVGTETYNGPGVSFNGTNWVFDPALAGIGLHTIKYKFTATAGGCVDSTEKTIRVLDTATARFALQNPACETLPVSFTDQSTAPAGITLQSTVWDFGDGTGVRTFTAGTVVQHSYNAAGTYTVTMYNLSTAGCRSNASSQQIVIHPIPVPAFTFPASLCLPAASVAFTNTTSISDGSLATLNYLWNFGDPASGANNTSTVKDPTHVYYSAGPFNVNLQVTSAAGCVHDTTITVSSIHPQPKADFTTNKVAICIGDNVTFTDASNGADGTITNWNWNFNDSSPIGTNPVETHTYNSADNYNVSLYIVNSFGCHSDTVSRPFKVYEPPTVNAGQDVFVLEGGSATLSPTYTGEDNIYLWTPADYLNNNAIANPVTTPLLDINYRILVSNPGGCSAWDEVMVKLLKAPNIPNTFSPNGDGINERWIIEYLDTYPNCRVMVFTRAGQKVFESRGYRTPWNGTMNGKTLPLDTYYYIIEPENGRKPITGFVTIIK